MQGTTQPRLYRWRFGAAEFDEARLELRANGLAVDIGQKPLQVLAVLLRHAGEVVTKQELFDSVWSGRVTVDHVLATAVGKLRKAFGPGSEDVIVTVPRIGYRLMGPVERVAVGDRSVSRLELRAGDAVPMRGHFLLERQLGPPGGSEVWLARHRKTGEPRVYKLSADGARLSALKREVTVARVLRESLGPRDDFVRMIDWNFEEAPWFIECDYGGPSLMEWADAGEPLQSLPRSERLDLFLQICDAVAAAHGVGVLHKDLKPANILVGEREAGRQIRITDFGSSRLLEPERLAALGITELGLTLTQGIGADTFQSTPLYVAPELVAGHAPTVQSDLYALGITLYQLLVGDLRRPMASGWEHEIDDELLREDIARATDGNPARRLSSVAGLAERLRDLDARHADRRRIEDIKRRERAANDALARSRARRPWVWATIGVLFSGLVVSLWLYAQGELARVHAETEARRASAINEFWNHELVGSGNPYLRDGGPDMPIQAVLERAADSLEGAFDGHPATAASIHEMLGDAFASLTDHDRAVREYRKAQLGYAAAFGADAPQALRAALQQAQAHAAASRFDESQAILDTFRISDASADSYAPEVVFATDMALAVHHYGRQEWHESVAYYQRVLAAEHYRGWPISRQLRLLTNTADAQQRVGRLDESERILGEALATARDRPDIPAAQMAAMELQLGAVLLDQDRYEEAEPLLLRAHQVLLSLLGEYHDSTLSASNVLTNLYMWTGRSGEALEYAGASYRAAVQSLGHGHHKTLMLQANLGLIQLYSGNRIDGVRTMSEARDGLAAHIGDTAPYVQMLEYYLMEALIEEDRDDEARTVLDRLDAEVLNSAQAGLRAGLRLRAIDALLEWKARNGTASREQLQGYLDDMEDCECRLKSIMEAAFAVR